MLQETHPNCVSDEIKENGLKKSIYKALKFLNLGSLACDKIYCVFQHWGPMATEAQETGPMLMFWSLLLQVSDSVLSLTHESPVFARN